MPLPSAINNMWNECDKISKSQLCTQGAKPQKSKSHRNLTNTTVPPKQGIGNRHPNWGQHVQMLPYKGCKPNNKKKKLERLF